MGPTTIAVATIASAVIGAVGVGMSAMSSAGQQRTQAAMASQQAAYARSMAARNQQIAEFAARNAEEKGTYEAGLARERARKLLGRQRALIGASGVDEYGSPLEVIGQSAAEGERDAQMILHNANYDAWKFRTAGETSLLEGINVAGRYDTQAGNLNSSAGTSILTGIVGTGGSLLNSATKYYSRNYGRGAWEDYRYGQD